MTDGIATGNLEVSHAAPAGLGQISVVVPAHNAAKTIGACLDGLLSAGFSESAIRVVDDGSSDGTAAICAKAGIAVDRLPGNSGASAARNAGAAAARGEILFFVDADVVVAPDCAAVLTAFFDTHGGHAAVFGAYDDDPGHPARVSRIRNLLHRHVHLKNAGEAVTFWTGCGAVRRRDFDAVGGFDTGLEMMEDIAFGMDLARTGRKIQLLPALQGKHLKRWTLWSMARTDLLHRAVPWARLLRSGRGRDLPKVLNIDRTSRISVLAVALSLAALLLGPFAPVASLAIMLGALAILVASNRQFLRSLMVAEGPLTALVAIPTLWIHYFCGGLGFAWVLAKG